MNIGKRFFLLVLAALIGVLGFEGTATAQSSSIQTDTVTVIGTKQKPSTTPSTTIYRTQGATIDDPGMPEDNVYEEPITPNIQKAAPAKTTKGTAGRKESDGFPWWIMLLLGGIAVAVGAA
ncbi:MAG: hypothetical protein JKX97_05950 [Candidatus Lindowbacteria bacterium]|nr:hypothetical protein [Candidatus Lindowbacteria bacterium]